MSESLLILGRQPALGLAELESLYGADTIKPVGSQAAVVSKPPDEIDINRLGGTIKVAKLLTRIDYNNWQKISDYLVEHVPKHTCCIGPGKLTFGISTYGLKIKSKDIERTALSVKKAVAKSDSRSVRVVLAKKGMELNSAQVLHNKMAKPPLGMELILLADKHGVVLAQTTAVQDIEAYTARDQARPKRDARVGMLPPKLAQIIINLAVSDADPKYGQVVLDPFCGTGVILQEATLMGFDVYGSDLDERLVGFAHDNLTWLAQQPFSNIIIHNENDLFCNLEVADATNYEWKPWPNFIACETYLGRPFSSAPDDSTLKTVISDVNTIHKKFLENVAQQTKPGFRMTIAVPAWFVGGKIKHMSVLDHLTDMGYTRVSFKYAANEDLIYHREGQIVGRELVTLIRK